MPPSPEAAPMAPGAANPVAMEAARAAMDLAAAAAPPASEAPIPVRVETPAAGFNVADALETPTLPPSSPFATQTMQQLPAEAPAPLSTPESTPVPAPVPVEVLPTSPVSPEPAPPVAVPPIPEAIPEPIPVPQPVTAPEAMPAQAAVNPDQILGAGDKLVFPPYNPEQPPVTPEVVRAPSPIIDRMKHLGSELAKTPEQPTAEQLTAVSAELIQVAMAAQIEAARLNSAA